MNTLVIYDSIFGNTKIIAETIADACGDNTKVASVSELKPEQDLKSYNLLIVGCPINGWRPSSKMQEFLSSLTPDQLKGCNVTSFDTRINTFFHGDAANKISTQLKNASATLITQPESFFVKGKKGPLVEGETQRAAEWAILIKAKAQAEYK